MKHGMCKSPEYYIWRGLRARCLNPRDKKYKHYGGRGIKVCRRWHDFRKFLSDMGYRPSSNHYLGRKDNNKDYSPNNCRWETQTQQQRNRSNNHLLTFKGRTLPIAGWSAITGFGVTTIRARITKLNWSITKTLTTQVRTCL